MKKHGFDFEEIKYGFKVERTISDPKWGVVLTIKTPRGELVVRVTPTGYFRLRPATYVQRKGGSK